MSDIDNKVYMDTRICGICQKPITPSGDSVDLTINGGNITELPDGNGITLMFHKACVNALEQVLQEETFKQGGNSPAPIQKGGGIRVQKSSPGATFRRVK